MLINSNTDSNVKTLFFFAKINFKCCKHNFRHFDLTIQNRFLQFGVKSISYFRHYSLIPFSTFLQVTNLTAVHVHHFLYYKLCRAVDIFQNLCRPFAIRAVDIFFLKVKLLESSSSPKINWIRAIDKKKYYCSNGVEQ